MATPEPDYELVGEYEAFELRRYEPYVVAEVTVKGKFSRAGNKAFRPLFRFISGNNQSREKIPMTAPVTQASGQEIPMTAPVTQQTAPGTPDVHRIGFVMPSGMRLADTPLPKDERVVHREEPERVMAVIRYSGTWSEKRFARHQDELLAALGAAGLAAVGDPVWARYNGPMTPWFVRRNEIMVEVDPTGL